MLARLKLIIAKIFVALLHSALSMAGTTAAWGLQPQPLATVARELTGQE